MQKEGYGSSAATTVDLVRLQTCTVPSLEVVAILLHKVDEKR